MRVLAQSLSYRYGESFALNEVSFELSGGASCVVLGANGSGKSTLLKLLATLLKPSGGDLSLGEFELPQQLVEARLSSGYLGHQATLYRSLSVRENLTFYARLLNVGRERVEQLIDLAGLVKVADQPVRTLSRGTVQRAAVCRCVLHSPQLLLLDEPYANLDPSARKLVDPLIGSQAKVTRILVSHQRDQDLEGADFVLGLKQGCLILFEPTDRVSDLQLGGVYDL